MILPDQPPRLTPAAARTLLRILLKAQAADRQAHDLQADDHETKECR